MVDMIKLATSISYKIRELETARDELSAVAQAVGPAIGAYRKRLAIVLIQLRNGVEMKLGEETIQSPPASYTLDIAHGICSKEKMDSETADTLFRAQLKICDMLQAELNGLQSINKHLSDI